MSNDQIAKMYDENFDKYAKSNQGKQNAIPGGMGAMRMCVETPSFLKAVGDIEGLRVLDAGCGEGNYSRAYKKDKKASRVVGIDISGALITAAAEREKEEGLGIDYRTLDLTQRDPSLVGEFDLVASAMVLMHLPTREALQAVAANLFSYIDPKKGGKLRAEFVQVEFDVNERPSDWEPRYGWYWSKPANGRTYSDGEKVEVDITFDPSVGPIHLNCHMWKKATYEEAFKKAGFANVRWIRQELFPENLKALGLPDDFFEPFVRLAPIWILAAEKRPVT
jgi:SAM-dependent methyltransferase